jgi:hypothetical protein
MARHRIKLAGDREILRTKMAITQSRLAIADNQDKIATNRAKLAQLVVKKKTPGA